MKSFFESVVAGTGQSFIVRKFEEAKFTAPYHHHPEYELTLILQGRGVRYIGNRMHNYSAGDLVLLGPDLPHYWKTEDSPGDTSISIVIHFRHDFMGDGFFDKPELKRVSEMLKQARAGLQYPPDLHRHAAQFYHLLNEKDHFSKWIMFLELLQELSKTKKSQVIDKQFANTSLSGTDLERINKITAYIVANFQQKISLDKAAAVVNMTPAALCRYFKKITRKTFIEAVNDYRIDYAINRLIQSEKTIAEVGYDRFKKRLQTRTVSSNLAKFPVYIYPLCGCEGFWVKINCKLAITGIV